MVGPLYMASFGISLNIDSSCVNRLNVKCSILEEIVLAEEAVDECNAAGNLNVLWFENTKNIVEHHRREFISSFV